MTATNSLRPGVFSTYTISSGSAAAVSAQYAAICARAVGGTAGTVYRFSSLEELAGTFTGGALYHGARLLLRSGVSQVVCVPASTDGTEPADSAYGDAFDAVAAIENIGAVVCDSEKAAVHTLLKASVCEASAALRERLGIVAMANAESAAAQALALASERICLCCPASVYEGQTGAFYTACAYAGLLLTSGVGENLSGSVCESIALAGENLAESAVQTLLGAGVTVFETVGGAVECIRGMTTRTKSDGVADYSLANVSTVRIIDQVLQRARARMKLLLKNARGSAATLQSIVAQMAVLLAEAESEGLLSEFATPLASISADDPSVCVVELAFTPATAINQIHIAARISL